MHPELDGWISFDRTGKPQKLVHGNFISTLDRKAGTSTLVLSAPYNAPRQPVRAEHWPKHKNFASRTRLHAIVMRGVI